MKLLLAQKTLESLEWPEVVVKLLRYCRTPQARLRLGASAESHLEDADHAGSRGEGSSGEGTREELRDSDSAAACALGELEQSIAGVRERLAETAEASQLLQLGENPPLTGVADLRRGLRRAEMGGVLSAQQLLDVRKTLETIGNMVRFLEARREPAPLLGGLAETIEHDPGLAREIENCLEPSGEVRDSASPALKAARREAGDLASQLQKRLGALPAGSRRSRRPVGLVLHRAQRSLCAPGARRFSRSRAGASCTTPRVRGPRCSSSPKRWWNSTTA